MRLAPWPALLAVAMCAAPRPPGVRAFGLPPPSARTLDEALARPTAGLRLYAMSTGQIEVPASAMIDPAHPRARPEDVGGKRWIENLGYLVRHPTAGDFLVDTGLGAPFAERPYGDLGWFTRWSVHTRVPSGHDVTTQLRALGAEPSKLKWVIITHGHVDHSGGLPGLGPVDVLVGASEPRAIYAFGALLKGFKADHFAATRSLFEADFDHAPELPPLGRAIDLVGDGSIWLVDTRGHTPGHLSVLVNLAGGPALLLGDAVQTPYALEEGIASGNVFDGPRAREVAERMRALHRQYPRLRFLYGHDLTGVRLAPESYE